MNPQSDKHAPSQKPGGTAFLYSLISRIQEFDDGIPMGRGDPDLDTPRHIVEDISAFLKTDQTGTKSPLTGLPELRDAIAKRVKKINNIDADPETDVIVTNGGQEAVFLIIHTLLQPGDEILVPVPAYNSFINAIEAAKAIMVNVPTYAEEAFEVKPDRVASAITSKTKSIILNSPNNPSAGVISPKNVKDIVKIAADHDLTIFADEIYDRFIYDDAKHLSPASLPKGRNRTLTLNALSKAYSMTGWRAGWIVGPEDLIRRVAHFKAGLSGPASLVAQKAAISALTGPQDCITEALEIYSRRRRIILDALDEMGLSYGLPKGGQFVFVDIRPTGMDCWTLVQRVLEDAHVLIYPGAAYGDDWADFIRITFLQPEEKVIEAMKRIKRVVLAVQAENRV